MNQTKLRYLIDKYCYLCSKNEDKANREKIETLLKEIKKLSKY